MGLQIGLQRNDENAAGESQEEMPNENLGHGVMAQEKETHQILRDPTDPMGTRPSSTWSPESLPATNAPEPDADGY